MRVPKQINLCGHTIKIEYRKKLIYQGVECWGIWDDSKHTIYLRMCMDKTRKLEILLHECIHAIADIHVMNLSEKAVKVLGIEILAMIRNNKLQFLERKRNG